MKLTAANSGLGCPIDFVKMTYGEHSGFMMTADLDKKPDNPAKLHVVIIRYPELDLNVPYVPVPGLAKYFGIKPGILQLCLEKIMTSGAGYENSASTVIDSTFPGGSAIPGIFDIPRHAGTHFSDTDLVQGVRLDIARFMFDPVVAPHLVPEQNHRYQNAYQTLAHAEIASQVLCHGNSAETDSVELVSRTICRIAATYGLLVQHHPRLMRHKDYRFVVHDFIVTDRNNSPCGIFIMSPRFDNFDIFESRFFSDEESGLFKPVAITIPYRISDMFSLVAESIPALMVA